MDFLGELEYAYPFVLDWISFNRVNTILYFLSKKTVFAIFLDIEGTAQYI